MSAAAVAFGIAGFATLNGGTTGGQGGATVTATTFDQLKSYLESSTTYIVRVDRRIYNGVERLARAENIRYIRRIKCGECISIS